MEDIATLWDLLNRLHSFDHMAVSEELELAGYRWEYSSRDNLYRLIDCQ